MNIYCDDEIRQNYEIFEDEHVKVLKMYFICDVNVGVRQEKGRVSFNMQMGDTLEVTLRKLTEQEVLRIYLGDSTEYIFEIDRANLVNIEERK